MLLHRPLLSAGAALGLAVAVVCGCTTDDDPAEMHLTVQKRVGSCYATMVEQAKPDKDLPLDGACKKHADPELIIGGDRVRVIVDYGVELSDGAAAPDAALTVRVDDGEVEATTETSTEHKGDKVWSILTFDVPDDDGDELRLSVATTEGYGTSVATPFQLVSPSLGVNVDSCETQDTCSLPAAVGNAQVTVSLPTVAARTGTLRSLVNGVEKSSVELTLDRLEGGVASAITSLPVPSAKPGSKWVLRANVGDATASTKPITLTAPAITAAISCGSPCSVAAESSVALKITAPLELEGDATITTASDGIPGVTVTLKLPQESLSKGTRSGSVALTAPKTVGASWTVDASIAGYEAGTILATVGPKPAASAAANSNTPP